MNQLRAVILLDDDSSHGNERPLMLEAVLFCPLLTWTGEKLKAEGVRRFFIVCGPELADEARACFAQTDEVTVSAAREDLLAFLREDGPVAIFPCAAAPVAGGANSAYTADAKALLDAWTEKSGEGVSGAKPLEGFTAVRTFAELQWIQTRCRDEIVRKHIANGVAFLDPSAVYLDPRVQIGRGTTVLPGTILRGNTIVGTDCEIGPNTMIRECTIGNHTTVNASQLLESTVGNRSNVGPFAYVRPNSHIGDDIKVGDFVEVKNSTIGNGTKISHLTYVGDSDVGESVNFGCGTVTTNYDGFRKYRCTIGNHVFIGCNTNLVAPVKLGNGCYTAAGSTVTKDVPDDALVIAREQEVIKEGWAARKRRLNGQK
jgi:bifunctional UDP-N-acetylglucosamine pyrophosphorylase/glucosamine-1-phosphate N-acetyltransferase